MVYDDTTERTEGALYALDLRPEEERWLEELGKLSELYLKRAETFVRYKYSRPIRSGGKLIPVTDALAEAQTFVETGRDIMLQEARVNLAAQRMEGKW